MDPASAPRTVIDSSGAPPRSIPTVLVVDDDPKFLARVRTWLGQRQVHLVCAETSKAALKAAHTYHVDLALVDYRLRARENGLVLAQTLHVAHRIPFIMVSQLQYRTRVSSSETGRQGLPRQANNSGRLAQGNRRCSDGRCPWRCC